MAYSFLNLTPLPSSWTFTSKLNLKVDHLSTVGNSYGYLTIDNLNINILGTLAISTFGWLVVETAFEMVESDK